uniref:Uncharacterized protein n=1 Tax=Rhizophora mucronata TaxID=61149 RepID=A0A2P2N4W6_RHIMU
MVLDSLTSALSRIGCKVLYKRTFMSNLSLLRKRGNTSKQFGGSLPVEKVQELASRNLKDAPLRYIRPDVEFDEVSIDKSLQIPVIDTSKLVDNQLGQDDNKELAKLHVACRDWGTFQV